MKTYETASFGAVAALNVLPYLTEEDEAEFYRQALRLVGNRGTIIVSHTNELVDLVTFNRYTVEFWRSRVIPSLTDSESVAEELSDVFASHLQFPARPIPVDARSERDKLRKRRINPFDYPARLLEKFGLRTEETAFTHFYPMPPQFMEESEEHKFKVYAFEDRMKNSPLRYVFASIMMLRLRANE